MRRGPQLQAAAPLLLLLLRPPRTRGPAAAAAPAATAEASPRRGCGQEYAESMAPMARASGYPLSFEPRFADLAAEGRVACAEAGGTTTGLQIDVPGYAARQAARLGDAAAGGGSAERKVFDFWREQFSPDDLANMREGIALCVPASCSEEPSTLPHIVLLFLSCLAGHCLQAGRDALDVPRVGADMNLTFDVDSFGLAGPDLELEHPVPHIAWVEEADVASRCWQEAEAVGYDFGVPIVPRTHCKHDERHVVDTLVPRIEQCHAAGGHMLLVRFDLFAYAARLGGEEAAAWSPELREAMRAFEEYFRRPGEEVGRIFVDGFGLCAPPNCTAGGGRELPRLILKVFLRSAQVGEQVGDEFPSPKWSLEFNASGWAASLRNTSARRCAVPRPEDELGSWERLPEEEAWRWFRIAGVSEGPPPAAAADFGAASSAASGGASGARGGAEGAAAGASLWAGCGGLALGDQWRRFELSLPGAGPPGEAPEERGLLMAVDELAATHWLNAQEWAAMISWEVEHSRITCDLTCVPYQRGLTRWKQEQGFCPSAFTATLLLRARRLQRAGLRQSARQDLGLARRLLGGCSTQDLFVGPAACAADARRAPARSAPAGSAPSESESESAAGGAAGGGDCQPRGGGLLEVRLDVLRYVDRLKHMVLSCNPAARAGMVDFIRSLEARPPEELRDRLCAPSSDSCRGWGWLPRVALPLVLGGVVDAARGGGLPRPRWGAELNVSRLGLSVETALESELEWEQAWATAALEGAATS